MPKPKSRNRRGRPPSPRFKTLPELRAAVFEEARRRIEKSLGRSWSDIQEVVDGDLDGFRRALETPDPDRETATDLVAAMRLAIARTATRNSAVALWVQENIAPLLDERDRDNPNLLNLDLLRLPSASLSSSSRVRAQLGGKTIAAPSNFITLAVEALDRLNFLGLQDREASDEEFACIALLKGHWPTLDSLAAKPLAGPEVISAVRKAVHKARREHGRPHFIRQWKIKHGYLDPSTGQETEKGRLDRLSSTVRRL